MKVEGEKFQPATFHPGSGNALPGLFGMKAFAWIVHCDHVRNR